MFILYHKSTKNVWKLQKYKNFSADYLECKKKVESVLFLDPWIWLQFTDIRSSSKVLHLIWDSWLYLRFLNSWFIKVKKKIEKIEWISSHHLHLQWKFKLWAGKFAWDIKAKHCWVLSTNFLFSKVYWQHSAMFFLYTSSKFSCPYLNFDQRWRWWDWIQVTL